MINEVHETLRAAVGGKVLDHHRFLFSGHPPLSPSADPFSSFPQKRASRTYCRERRECEYFPKPKETQSNYISGKVCYFWHFFRSF